MKYVVSLLLVTTLLTACQAAPGNFNAQMLPDVQEFSKEDQKAAAEELKAHQADLPVTLGKILPACKVMRDQTRAIKKELGGK